MLWQNYLFGNIFSKKKEAWGLCQFISSEACLMPHNRRKSSALSSISHTTSWIPSSSSHFKNGQDEKEEVKVRDSLEGNTGWAAGESALSECLFPLTVIWQFFVLLLPLRLQLHSFGERRESMFSSTIFPCRSFNFFHSPDLVLYSSTDRTWKSSPPILSILMASEITHFWLLSSHYPLPFNTCFTALSLPFTLECGSSRFFRYFRLVQRISNICFLGSGWLLPTVSTTYIHAVV